MMDPVLVDMAFAVPVSESAIFWISSILPNRFISRFFIYLVSFRCGGNSRENNTYFESGINVNPGDCRIKICPLNDGICQVYIYMIIENRYIPIVVR